MQYEETEHREVSGLTKVTQLISSLVMNQTQLIWDQSPGP